MFWFADSQKTEVVNTVDGVSDETGGRGISGRKD